MERLECSNLLIQALQSWCAVEMFDTILVTWALLNDLPSYTVVLYFACTAIEVVKKTAEGVYNIFRSPLSRVAVLPRIDLFPRFEYAPEGFRARYGRYGSGERQWPVEGEERGHGDIWSGGQQDSSIVHIGCLLTVLLEMLRTRH